MSGTFRTVGLIGKQDDARVAETLARLVDFLLPLDVEVLCDRASAVLPGKALEVVDRANLGERCDLVVVVAGDGTFLGAARSLVDHDVPVLGVNLGRLGFLADVMPDEMTERLRDVLAGNYEEERRFLLHTRVMRGDRAVLEGDALNEVVVHKWNIARLIQFETRIDGRLVNSQRSDGLIVATPTGSTAYALSGGGPILHPGLDAIVVVPICPHTLSSRPLVVTADSTIEVLVSADERPEALITWDGQTSEPIEPGDRIEIRRKEQRLRLVHPRGYDYYATLRAKLHWAREL
ncbi:MAG: NAD(+) kinase [Gammaproteobacteria bacterium]|nr:NAD(+) kinase [Gammaproteobacteria bacterium]